MIRCSLLGFGGESYRSVRRFPPLQLYYLDF